MCYVYCKIIIFSCSFTNLFPFTFSFDNFRFYFILPHNHQVNINKAIFGKEFSNEIVIVTQLYYVYVYQEPEKK